MRKLGTSFIPSLKRAYWNACMCEEFIEERCEKLIKREMSLSCNVIGYQYLAFYEAKGAKLANKKPSFIFKEPIGKTNTHWPFVPF